MARDPKELVKCELNVVEWNIIMDALSSKPFAVVAPIISKLSGQFRIHELASRMGASKVAPEEAEQPQLPLPPAD